MADRLEELRAKAAHAAKWADYNVANRNPHAKREAELDAWAVAEIERLRAALVIAEANKDKAIREWDLAEEERDAARAALAAAERREGELRWLLTQREWAGAPEEVDGCYWPTCLECNGIPKTGHAEDCALAAALGKGEGK